MKKIIFSVRPLGDFSPEVQGRFINVDNNGSLVHIPFKNSLFYILKHVQPNRFELHSVHTWVHVDSVGQLCHADVGGPLQAQGHVNMNGL